MVERVVLFVLLGLKPAILVRPGTARAVVATVFALTISFAPTISFALTISFIPLSLSSPSRGLGGGGDVVGPLVGQSTAASRGFASSADRTPHPSQGVVSPLGEAAETHMAASAPG